MAHLRRVLLLLIAVALAGCASGAPDIRLERAAQPPSEPVIAEAVPDTVVTVAPTTTTVAPPVTTAPPPPTTVAPAPQPALPRQAARPAADIGDRFTMAPYRGLGSWLDVYDWSSTYAKGGPPAGVEAVDRMATAGVQTLFIQASRWDSPTDVVERDRLIGLIDKAHARGMRVIGWYLPTLEDPAADLRRLVAIAKLPVDGLGVDIESRKVPDTAERNRRLLELSAALRSALPGEVIGAIPMEPVLMEDVNPNFWPGFPWRELASYYDVWLAMSYWTNRAASSPYRDPYTYTAANIDRMRKNLGWLDAPVHALGGIADKTTVAGVEGMHRAAAERGAIGGSLYDYRTTGDALWEPLRAFRV